MREINNTKFIETGAGPKLNDIVSAKDHIGFMLTSQGEHLLHMTLSMGADVDSIKTLIGRKKVLGRHSLIELVEDDKKDTRSVRYKSKTELIEVCLNNLDLIKKYKRAIKDFFVIIFMKLPEQAVFKGTLIRDNVRITTQELVDLGLYKNKKVAKQTFDNIQNALTSFKIRGEYRISENKKDTTSYTDVERTTCVLFPTCSSKKYRGELEVSLNERVNWGALARFLTPMPLFYGKLSPRAKDLLYLICFRAANSKRDIKEKGFFRIRYRTIQANLPLPNEVNCKSPKKLIKAPIENAVTEIEEANFEIDRELKFTITPYPALDEKSNMNISEFLDKGYLEIRFSGDFAAFYIEGYDKQTRMIKEAKAKREKLEEKIAIKRAERGMDKESA